MHRGSSAASSVHAHGFARSNVRRRLPHSRFRIGVYALWPFGQTVVAKPTAGVGSFLGNVIWVILAGLWLALGNIAFGIALCITIIGIPLGIASFKLVPVSLMPLGKEIVPVDGRRVAF
jgi:uncharacterized membrane protein YccF (DUF307 family)